MMELPDHYKALLKIQKNSRAKVNLEDKIEDENVSVVDEYWIIPEFSKVQIRKNIETLELLYYLIEPSVAQDEVELLNFVYEDVRRRLVLKDTKIESERVKIKSLLECLDEVLDEYALRLESELTLKTLYYLFRDFFGYGPIDCLLLDQNLEDISCDGYDIPIYVFHKKYGSLQTNIKLKKEELDSLVLLLSQKSEKHISFATPLVDATLPDGSRLQLTYGSDITTRGSTFSIRKFRAQPFTPIDLMYFGTLDSKILAYYWLLIENKMNFMVIGETAVGKTTTLNALMMFLPPGAKVVSIEDTREIQLYHENWIPSVTRVSIEGKEITMYDLLKTSLRQRPDYIIVGEVRGKEAQTLFQAMSTGHASYSTFHSGDIAQLIYRLENEPLNVPRVMIQFLDSVIVQTMWVGKGVRKRRAKEIAEFVGLDPNSKELLINQLYKWDPTTDSFMQVSESKKLEKISAFLGVTVAEVLDELNRRKEFLELMYSKGIRDYKSVTSLVHSYYRDPEKAFENVREWNYG